MREMADNWLFAEERLQIEVKAVADKIALMRAQGIEVKPWRLTQLEQYRELLAGARREAARYSEYAVRIITQEQLEYGWLAQQQAVQAIEGVSAGMVPAFASLNPQAIEATVGLLGDGTPLSLYFRATLPAESVIGIQRELTVAIARGLNPVQTARAINRGFGVGFHRSVVIARTEQMRIYREVQQAQYQEADFVIGYKRLAAHQDRTCLGCIVKDGQFYPVDQPIEDHPQGRCTSVPVLRHFAVPGWETGQEWLAKQNPDVQEKIMGEGLHKLYASGQVPLSDMARHIENKTFGGSWVPARVSDLAPTH